MVIAVKSVQKGEEEFVEKGRNQIAYLKVEEFVEKRRSSTAYLKAEEFAEKGRNQIA